MDNSKKPRLQSDMKLASIERWTIERIDRDTGMARLESVPMRDEYATRKLVSTISKNGLDSDADNIEFWNTKKAGIKQMKLNSLIKLLNLRQNEEKALKENMVFWAIRYSDKKKPEKMFHATTAARQLSKKLYQKVTHTEGDE